MNTAMFVIAAYLVSSIPFGLILARLAKGIDIRQHGSGNIGATNVLRVVGRKWALLVFSLDTFKGIFAVVMPEIVLGERPPIPVALLLGAAAIAGHTFPVWLRFKGGKGVATSLGVFLAVALVPTLLTFALWVLVFAITRIISAASLTAAVAFPAVLFFMERAEPDREWLLAMGLLLTVFIFFTHRANIGRLLKGEEKKIF